MTAPRPWVKSFRRTNDRPYRATKLRVFLHPTHTVIEGGFVGDRVPPDGPPAKLVNSALEILLPAPGVAPKASADFGIVYRGSPPSVAAVQWLPGPGDFEGLAPLGADRDLADLEYNPSRRTLAERRWKSIQKMPAGEERSLKEFFCRLDFATNADLAQAQGPKDPRVRPASVSAVQRDLDARAQLRGRGKKLPPNPLGGTLRADVEGVERVMRPLLASLGSVKELGDRAFEAFALGDLRMSDPIPPADPIVDFKMGEPDGSNYFLFAEFALVARDIGGLRAVWSPWLRIFVRTQELYAKAYRPASDQDLIWPLYGRERSDKPVEPGLAHTLRETYVAIPDDRLEERMQHNLMATFRW